MLPIPVKTQNILIISQDIKQADFLRALVAPETGQCHSIDSAAMVEDFLSEHKCDYIIYDTQASGANSIASLTWLHGQYPQIAIIALLESFQEDLGPQVLNQGAHDFLIKGKVDTYVLAKALQYSFDRLETEYLLRRAYDDLDIAVSNRTRQLLEANSRLQNEVSQHNKTEDMLAQSETRLRTVLEAVTEGITFSDEHGQFYVYNPAMEQITGYSMQEANSSSDFSRLLYPDPHEWSKAFAGIGELIQKDQAREVESKITTKSGTVKHVLISSSLINYNGKRMFLSVYRDITARKTAEEDLRRAHQDLENKVRSRTQELAQINQELKNEIIVRRKAQEELQESESRYRLLAENIKDVVWLADLDYRWIYISPSVYSLLGYTVEQMTGKKIEDILTSGSYAMVKQMLREDIVAHKDIMRSRTLELECKRSDGLSVWVEVKIDAIYNAQGQPFRIMGAARDISERKKTMERLFNSLKEKETLLQEIHHRVKNNLQIVSSLLNLQSSRIQDKTVLSVFKESYNRIRSMALIHEKLYKSYDLAQIDFGEYVSNLAQELFNSYRVNSSLIHMDINVQDLYLNIDTAIPCGLIINELISNALKYAFAPGANGMIHISLSKTGDIYVLEFMDNGVGLPQGMDFRKTNSLGMQLVANLTAQLEGGIELDKGHQGARFIITFKERK